MNPESDSLLALATSRLAHNPELHLAARSMLASRIDASGTDPSQVDAAAITLKTADASALRRHWRKALYAMAFLLAGIGGFRAFRDWDQLVWFRDAMGYGSSTGFEPTPTPGLSPSQSLLLFGETSASSQADRWRPLWQSAPDNPAFLAQYAAGCFSDRGKLPDEVIEAAKRIDPDNGWYPALIAASLLDGAVTRETQNRADRKAFKTPVCTIKDPARLEQVLAQIHEAASKPRFSSYHKELIAMRIPLLPPRTDLSSSLSTLAYTVSITTQSVHFRKFTDAFAAAAAEHATNGNRDAFLKIAADHSSISRKVIEDSFSLVEMLISKNLLILPSRNLRDAASMLGLEEVHTRYENLATWELADRTRRETRVATDPIAEVASRKGSLLAGLTTPALARQVSKPPTLTEADFQPMRHAEHALIVRYLVCATVILLALASGVAACQRYFTSPLIHSLSTRMGDLFSPRDHLIALTAGPVLPMMGYTAVIYLTPLSSREWALQGPDGFTILILGQAAACLILMMAFPLALAASIMDRRAAVFGLVARSWKTRWFVILCGFLSIPAFGLLGPAQHELKLPNTALYSLLALASSLAAAPLLWMLAGFLQPVFGTRESTLRLATLTRIAPTCWAACIMAIVATIPLLQSDERRSVARDSLFAISAEAPAISRFEWDVTLCLRDELKELISPFPSDVGSEKDH